MRWNLLSDDLSDLLVILAHIFDLCCDPFLPEIRVVNLVLALNLQRVAVKIGEICKRWKDIERVARYHDHFVCNEGSACGCVIRIVRLANPDSIRVTSDVLS